MKQLSKMAEIQKNPTNVDSQNNNTHRGFENGINGFEKDINGLERGINGFERGINGLERGINGFDRGINGFERGINGFERDINGFERGINGFEHCIIGKYCNNESVSITRDVTDSDKINKLDIQTQFVKENNERNLKENTEGHTRTAIQNFYHGKNIFITGGTGFLGKLMIEKLLRSCPGIENLYLLVRQKKGKDIYTRIEEVFDDAMFERLKQEFPKFRHKVTVVPGDCSAAGLGLSLEDRQTLIEKVHIIFHAAATVKFDEHLRIALATNVEAALNALCLAKQMKQLQIMMHVSTAYSNCHLKRIEERLYELPTQLESLNRLVDKLDDQQLNRVLPEILGDWPNTYTYTKALAESEVKRNCGSVPITIFRPAIVTSTSKEPIPGWIDNMYGPTGVVTGAATGVLRTVHCDEAVTAEIVPADYVVNCLLAAAEHTSIGKRSHLKEPPVYNYVSSPENKLTWGLFMHLIYTYSFNYPLSSAVWYRSINLNKYATMNAIYKIFLHLLPAFILDGLFVCFGQTPKLLKVYRKIHKFSSILSYFTTNDIVFCNDNVQQLWRDVSDQDKLMYPFSMRELDWVEYFTLYLRGIRTHLFKETDDTLKHARTKWNRLYYLHQVVKILFATGSFYIIFTLVESIFNRIFI